MMSKKQKVEREQSYLNNYLRVMDGANTFRSGFIAMYTKLGYPNNMDAPEDLKKLFEKACEQERFPDFGAIDPRIDPSEFKTMNEDELLKFRKQFVTVSNQDSSKTMLEMEVSCRTAYLMALLDEELRVRHKARVPVKPVEFQPVFETPLKLVLTGNSKKKAKKGEAGQESDEEV
jgi:hypothetical protein